MDAKELVEVSTQVAQLGGELTELRDQRKVLDEQIAQKEKELEPLLVRHEELIRELRGAPKAPPPVLASAPSGPHAPSRGPADRADSPELRKRLMLFLERAEPGISAAEIADALKVDPVLVRQVMMDMARQSPTPPQERELASS